MYPIEYTWMSVPTPEISRTKVIDSWSSWKAMSAWKPSTGIQVYRRWYRVRSSALRDSMSANSAAPIPKETAASRVPIQ